MFPIIAKGRLSQLYSQSIIYIHFSGFHQMQSDWTQPLNRIQRELLEFYLFIYLLIYYYYLAVCLQLQICLHCSINLITYLGFKLSPECPHRKYLCNVWRSCALHLWLRLWVTFLMNTYAGFLHSKYTFSKSVCVYLYTLGPGKSCNGKEASEYIFFLLFPKEMGFPCHRNPNIQSLLLAGRHANYISSASICLSQMFHCQILTGGQITLTVYS